jgi:hypothetical protein
MLVQYVNSKLPHNKPLVPTRNGEAPLLAAYARRWAARVNMSSERHHRLTFPLQRHGATSAYILTSAIVCSLVPQLRSTIAAARRRKPAEAAVRVASLRAQFRSSSCRRARASRATEIHRGGAARSDITGLSQACLHWSAQWPNSSLVPTPTTNALSLSVGSGAAHLKR